MSSLNSWLKGLVSSLFESHFNFDLLMGLLYQNTNERRNPGIVMLTEQRSSFDEYFCKSQTFYISSANVCRCSQVILFHLKTNLQDNYCQSYYWEHINVIRSNNKTNVCIIFDVKKMFFSLLDIWYVDGYSSSKFLDMNIWATFFFKPYIHLINFLDIGI